MTKQLTFEGHPAFEPRTMDWIIKDLFIGPIHKELEATRTLLTFDFNRQAFPGGQPSAPPEPLFKPAPRCDAWLGLDDDYLDCNLDAGHGGPHYDAVRRIEWSQR